jgi:CDP-glycerol glycerophosphotransferase (TagB/SpsB family)
MRRELPRKILKHFIYTIGYGVIIPLAHLVPKANYVVLISRFGDFEGNLKYLFLYLTGLKEEKIEFIFLTDKKEVYRNLIKSGFKVWFYPAFLTLFKLLRTRIIIVDGGEWAVKFKFLFLFKSKKVQIWHAAGLKVIGLLRPTIKQLSKFRRRFKIENIFYDLVVFSSEYQAAVRSKAFRYGRQLINGLPRNDIFFKPNMVVNNSLGSDSQVIERVITLKENGYKLITYTPTWRKTNYNLDHLDLGSLNDFARFYNLIFIIKLHPKHKCRLELNKFNQIIEYNQRSDVYPLLTITDMLITDYSSIYIDFLLTDRPIIFYPYDSSDYIGKERELLFDYEQVTPGPKCYSSKELEQEIYRLFVEGRDDYMADRDNIRKKFFHYVDGKSAERLWNAVRESMLVS